MEDLQNNDVILNFSFKDINVRGKIVRLKEVSGAITQRFSSHKAIDKVLLDSLVLSTIIASNFKFDGIFKFQLNCYESLLKVLLCNNNLNGDMNAYLSLEEEKLKEIPLGQDISFREIVGSGYILFHLDQKLGKNYQAVVEIVGESIEDSAKDWFLKSEQIQTHIKIISNVEKRESVGIFLQILPDVNLDNEGEIKAQEDFKAVKSVLDKVEDKRFLDENLTLLLEDIYGIFDLVIFETKKLQYKCSCNREQIASFVSTINEDEVDAIKKEHDGCLEIECVFCGTKYIF